MQLVSVDYFNFNSTLTKMVLNGLISTVDREELLHKSGLIKSEGRKWKEPNGAILTFNDIISETLPN